MKRLIGSLLVITILSHPPILDNDAIKYQVLSSLNADKSIILMLEINNTDEADMALFDHINELFTEIEGSTSKLTSLLKKKRDIDGKIRERLAKLQAKKVFLSDNQMTSFAQYGRIVDYNNSDILDALKEIEKKRTQRDIENELLKKDADILYIKNELELLKFNQQIAISGLREIIDAGNSVLEII